MPYKLYIGYIESTIKFIGEYETLNELDDCIPKYYGCQLTFVKIKDEWEDFNFRPDTDNYAVWFASMGGVPSRITRDAFMWAPDDMLPDIIETTPVEWFMDRITDQELINAIIPFARNIELLKTCEIHGYTLVTDNWFYAILVHFPHLITTPTKEMAIYLNKHTVADFYYHHPDTDFTRVDDIEVLEWLDSRCDLTHSQIRSWLRKFPHNRVRYLQTYSVSQLLKFYVNDTITVQDIFDAVDVYNIYMKLHQPHHIIEFYNEALCRDVYLPEPQPNTVSEFFEYYTHLGIVSVKYSHLVGMCRLVPGYSYPLEMTRVHNHEVWTITEEDYVGFCMEAFGSLPDETPKHNFGIKL